MLTSRESKELRGLQRRRVREREGRFLAEGVRLVEDLLESSLTVHWTVSASSLEDSDRGRALAAEIDRRGVPRRRVSDAEFDGLAATEHPQGVLAVASAPARTLDDLASGSAPEVVLLLDAVQDPGNFGTLVRSAEALGAAGVVALTGTVDPWNPKAVRSAMGSSFRLPVVVAEWEEAETWLRGREFVLLAAAAGGEPLPTGLPRAALVVGNEGSGIAPEILAGVDRTVGIPLRGRAESLNVAAAASILLYELTR